MKQLRNAFRGTDMFDAVKTGKVILKNNDISPALAASTEAWQVDYAAAKGKVAHCAGFH